MDYLNYQLLVPDREEQKDSRSALFFPARRPRLGGYQLSIVIGLIWALLAGLFTLMSMNGKARLITDLYEMLIPGYDIPPSPESFDVIINLGLGLTFGFFYGFMFGLLMSTVYNRLRPARICDIKLNGKIMTGKVMRLFEKGNPDAETTSEKTNAYTVLIVANQFIESEFCKPNSGPNQPAGRDWRRDPILSEPDLFRLRVACIIDSLRKDKNVVGPRMKRMRFLVLFDPNVDKDTLDKNERALCFEEPASTTIEPIQGNIRRVERGGDWEVGDDNRLVNFLKKYGLSHKDDLDDETPLGQVDVVYAVTASETNTRSSARYTIERAFKFSKTDQSDFQFITNGTKREPDVKEGLYNPEVLCPGIVAYSAWEMREKAAIHEFAHAASSTDNGLVVDEYNDELGFDPEGMLVINKRHLIPVDDFEGDLPLGGRPHDFVEYVDNGSRRFYLTDQYRQQPQEWESFVPARADASIPCTMDLSYDEHAFDKLIEKFFIRRLEAKF
ncbi:MAG: hypothetical protein ACE5IR_08035 [bacterium]